MQDKKDKIHGKTGKEMATVKGAAEGFTAKDVKAIERQDFVYDPDEGVFFPQWDGFATKEAWLTFDDGPHPTYTDKILSTLADVKAKATFFMVGQEAAAYPNVAKRVFDAGHRVGNHSWSHQKLTTLDEAGIKAEIIQAEKVLAPYLGAKKVFRQPYGATNARVEKVITDLGYRSVLWTVDTEDWDPAHQPTDWMSLGLAQVKKKSHCVILMHDIQKTTAEHLSEFIASLRLIPSVYPFKVPPDL